MSNVDTLKRDIKVLTFDLYGTIVDMQSGLTDVARPFLEGKGYEVGEGQGVGDNIYVITHVRCTECVGHFDEPQCAAVCPVDDCCISDPLYPETTDVLLEKAKKLNPDKQIDDSKVWSGVRN